MKIYFDNDGYPAHIKFDNSEKEDFNSDNFLSIMRLSDKLNLLCEYWNSLSEACELHKLGGMSDKKYKQLIEKKQKHYFKDLLESGYSFAYIT